MNEPAPPPGDPDDGGSRPAGEPPSSSSSAFAETVPETSPAPTPFPNLPTRRLVPGEVLAGRYVILEELGRGGMGVVHKARDVELDRLVALKTIRPESAADPRMIDRLRHEVALASEVTHPNVCRIHDLAEVDGLRFVSMQYVEGRTLRDQLRRAGRLSVAAALDVVRQIAAALEAAHARGIVHRDLKPGNVLLDREGRAYVTDFGIATLARGLSSGRARVAVGTPAYMSPEQRLGLAVDARTDLYALGCILYELLTGSRPFPAGNRDAPREPGGTPPPPPPSRRAPAVLPWLDAVVLRCLEEDPQRRYAGARELLRDLESAGGNPPPDPQASRSIAVLPFAVPAGRAEHACLGSGFMDELIADLSAIRSLKVISRGSALALAGTLADEAAAARTLGVRYVLAGSVRVTGSRLRVNARLIDGPEGAVVWADKHQGTLDDLFDIQERLSRRAAAALRVRLSVEEDASLRDRPIGDVRAYECWLRARQDVYRFTERSLEAAVGHLQEGLAIVGDNALLRAELGHAYWQFVNMAFRPGEEYLQRAEECARRALDLAPHSSHGRRLLGLIAFTRGHTQELVDQLKQALKYDPGDRDALLWLCIGYADAGWPAAGLPFAERLVDIDPLTPANHAARGWLHLAEGRPEQAWEAFERWRSREPHNPVPCLACARCLAYLGRVAEAQRGFAAVADEQSASFPGRMARFLERAWRGDREGVRSAAVPELLDAARGDPHFSWNLGEGFAVADEADRALDWLGNAVDRGFFSPRFFERWNPALERLRHDPRLAALAERVRLEHERFVV